MICCEVLDTALDRCLIKCTKMPLCSFPRALYYLERCILLLVITVIFLKLLDFLKLTSTSEALPDRPVRVSGFTVPNGPVYTTYKNYTICTWIDQSHLADIPTRPHHMEEVTTYVGPQLNLYLFAAYYDDRDALYDGGNAQVLVTGVVHRDTMANITRMQCYLWYDGDGSAYSVPGEGELIWEYYGPYQSVIIACPLPDGLTERRGRPFKVSIAKHLCDKPSNVLPLHRQSFSGRTSGVGVCSKVIYSRPDPVRIIEWVELNYLLGAANIYMYNTSLEGVVNDVLDYYQRIGRVTLKQHEFMNYMARVAYNTTFPTFHYQLNWELEVISMTDCLYTARERYLVNIDIDEILYPIRHRNFSEFIRQSGFDVHSDIAGLVFHTGVFTDEFGEDPNSTAPGYLHTMRHTTRTAIDWESPKSIAHADRCRTLAHHICMQSRSRYERRMDVPENLGYLRHYRQKCRLTGEPNKCEKLLKNPVKDTLLNKYQDILNDHVKPILEKFDLLKTKN